MGEDNSTHGWHKKKYLSSKGSINPNLRQREATTNQKLGFARLGNQMSFDFIKGKGS